MALRRYSGGGREMSQIREKNEALRVFVIIEMPQLCIVSYLYTQAYVRYFHHFSNEFYLLLYSNVHKMMAFYA